MGMINIITVEVAYAKQDHQQVIAVSVVAGSTIAMVIQQSGILATFPEIDLSRQAVGIFSEPRLLSDVVKAGDRVEIYRSLTMDPKEARRKRAKLSRRAR